MSVRRVASLALSVALPIALPIALPAAGCGLFETQESFTLFPDAQPVSRVDAGTDATSGTKPDASHGDATLDAKGDAGTDGGHDAGADSARLDATSDARHQDAPSDSPSEDARDAGHDAPVDAFHGPHYCAVTIPDVPPGVSAFCEDFDEDASASLLAGEIMVTSPSTLALESTVSRSSPNAALVKASLDGGSTIAYLAYSLPVATATYSIEFDMSFSTFAQSSGTTTVIIAVAFGSGSHLSQISISALPTGLGAGVQHLQVIESEPGDGGVSSKIHALPDGSIGSGTWTHIRLQLKSAGTTWFDYLDVNDASLETLELRPGFANTALPASAHIGVVYAEGDGTRNFYIDNVLVESQ